jgi:tRNA(adenine34) deaminase
MLAAGGASTLLYPRRAAAALGEREQHFVAEALRMKTEAVASGDQAFGAIVVRGGAIVGYGPSRVILDDNREAHAERVAMWDAQRRLNTKDLQGAVMYSTSRPCANCQHALSLANLDRMYFGPEATDAGRPQPRAE